MSTSSIKRQIRRFHVVVVQWTSKKFTKMGEGRHCGRRRGFLSSLFRGETSVDVAISRLFSHAT